MRSVSVVGLGLMGRPIARTLLAAGFDVVGWNRSELPDELTVGIPRARSLLEATGGDIVALVLADSSATGEVLADLGPHLREGTIVLDLGSSEPADSRSRAARLAERGIGWVDAPVSGGPEGAESGTLTIMMGGEVRDIRKARPALEALGRNVTHVGGPGAGHLSKIVNQLIVALSIETVAEALALAEAAGLTIPDVQRALRGGSADLPQLRSQGTRMAERNWQPGAKARTVLKDLHMAQRLAAAHGLRLPQLAAAVGRYEDLVNRGEGDRDVSMLFELSSGGAGRARYQAITDALLATTGASRTTIRLDLPEATFPVVAESLAPGVPSIAGQEVPGLRRAPTMVYLAETLGVLAQDDLLDTDIPPPKALIEVYGARAQMIAAIVRDGALAGVVSVHDGPDPRVWTVEDVGLIRGAAEAAAAVLGSEPSD